MTLVNLHGLVGNAAMYFMLILAVWALWTWLRGQGLNGSYWGALVIAEGLMIVQALLGVALLLTGRAPGRSIHILYGVLAVISIPAALAYLRTGSGRREALLYGLATLVIFGFTVRAITTAAGAGPGF
jgi:heme A synthase